MDQSMICLPSDVKTALEKTNFIKRYEMLSNTFNGERTPLNERLRYIDGEIVLDSLAQLGYKAHFEAYPTVLRPDSYSSPGQHSSTFPLTLKNLLPDISTISKKRFFRPDFCKIFSAKLLFQILAGGYLLGTLM